MGSEMCIRDSLFTSRLAHRTEVIAMLSSGVSFPRVMKPYFVAATFLTALSLIVNHMVLPGANKVRLAFEEEHIRVTFFVDAKNIHREITPGTIAYMESYNVCLLYTSDAADERSSVDLGGRRIIKTKNRKKKKNSTTSIKK